MNNIYDFFLPIYRQYGIGAICDGLYLHKGTVNRWMEKKEVPPQYYFDLCRVAGVEVNYSQFSEKRRTSSLLISKQHSIVTKKQLKS